MILKAVTPPFLEFIKHGGRPVSSEHFIGIGEETPGIWGSGCDKRRVDMAQVVAYGLPVERVDGPAFPSRCGSFNLLQGP